MRAGREEKPVKQPSAKVPVSCEGGGRVPAGGVAIARPEQIHDLLNYSSGYVGEGASMAKEAAVLGVPSVYVSALRGLVPIDVLGKEGRIRVLHKFTLGSIVESLSSRPGQMQMCDVTETILRVVER